MTLRLTIDERAWRAHVQHCRDTISDLIPVVKGNGYGIGRVPLATIASEWATEIAVGTVHELANVAAVAPGTAVLSLTPAVHLTDELAPNAVPTVGSLAHVVALRDHGWHGPVAVKLASSMRRHGATPAEVADVVDALRTAGMQLHQFVLHLPLSSTPTPTDTGFDEATAWLASLDRVDRDAPLSVGHVHVEAYDRLRAAHAERRFRFRSGTALWHGDKSSLHLAADVLEVRSIAAGEQAGYHRSAAPIAGHLVMVGAGSAHGVVALDGGLSPFHHARRRMPLLEPPHMHTSMVLVADGEPVPAVGDWVDVQRPLIMVTPDEVRWR
jgi:alanine racemase